jgi:putative ubiquitin-RnfH superfamily antitoxin RatB of RatAB toxin-antitoxin module
MANAEAAKVGDITIEVVYALPDRQLVVPLTVVAGTTLRQAAQQSGLPAQFGLAPEALNLGVFGRLEKAPDTATVRQGDRVEIYRPLTIDPKAARAARAAKAKAKRKA